MHYNSQFNSLFLNRCSNAIHLTMIAAGNGDAPKPAAY